VSADPFIGASHPPPELAEIVQSNVKTVGADKMGQVTAGFVRIRGHLLKARINTSSGNHYPAVAQVFSYN
jgi:hypothetical protein